MWLMTLVYQRHIFILLSYLSRLSMLPLWSIFAELLLVVVCLGGDHLLEEPDIARYAWLRALIDSSTHGAVGMLSWMAVLGQGCRKDGALEVVVAAMLAMFVDTDHFIAARSLKLKDALSLYSRPPFHCTTLVILGFFILFGFQTLGASSSHPVLFKNIPWIFLVAWLSHHIRDAHRRGLWFWPLGSTRALPRWLYIGATVTLPIIVRTAVIKMQTPAPQNLPFHA